MSDKKKKAYVVKVAIVVKDEDLKAATTSILYSLDYHDSYEIMSIQGERWPAYDPDPEITTEAVVEDKPEGDEDGPF